MKDWLVPYLVSPRTGAALQLRNAVREGDEIVSGMLESTSGEQFAVKAGIPRFVEQHYAKNFALQWTTHKRTQFDSVLHQHSKENFWGKTGFDPLAMTDKLVLDAGCGSGRYSQVAASAGARIVGVDLSEAVDAANENLGKLPNVSIVQASLFDLPFRPGTFDYVFCLGVIQHTPDPLKALASIADMVKPGGEIGVYWYKKYIWTYFQQKYILRPFLRGRDPDRLYAFVRWYVPKLLPLSRLVTKLPFFGAPYNLSERILPVANRDYVGNLSEQDKLDWAILDTYDWYSPRYDRPQSWKAVQATLARHGFDYERTPMRGINGRRVRVAGVENAAAARGSTDPVVVRPSERH